MGSMETNRSVHTDTRTSDFYYNMDLNGKVIFWSLPWRIVWMELKNGFPKMGTITNVIAITKKLIVSDSYKLLISRFFSV